MSTYYDEATDTMHDAYTDARDGRTREYAELRAYPYDDAPDDNGSLTVLGIPSGTDPHYGYVVSIHAVSAS